MFFCLGLMIFLGGSVRRGGRGGRRGRGRGGRRGRGRGGRGGRGRGRGLYFLSVSEKVICVWCRSPW